MECNNIVFFDGYCPLCSTTVDLLLKMDFKQKLKFASLQGQTAAKYLPVETIENLKSIVFWRDNQAYEKSAALIHILWKIGGVYGWIGSLLNCLPLKLLNLGYNFISKRRYGLFGKRETCRLPKANEHDRFIDS